MRLTNATFLVTYKRLPSTMTPKSKSILGWFSFTQLYNDHMWIKWLLKKTNATPSIILFNGIILVKRNVKKILV